MTKKTLLQSMLAAGLLSGAAVSQACNIDAWLGTNGANGSAQAGGPAESLELSRYSGSCSMQAGTAVGAVQDNSPNNEARMITRFYFLAEGTGTAKIYQAFSDQPADASAAGTEIYSVSFNGSTNEITVASVGGTVTLPGKTGWNSVEVDWNAGSNMNIWVNVDAASAPATSDTAPSGTGTISASRLGVLDGSGLTVTFDDFESRRSTNVGRLLKGDANASGTIELTDAVLVLNESLGFSISIGTPDFNEDGGVTLTDAVQTLNEFLFGP